jgi:hypothetical protein
MNLEDSSTYQLILLRGQLQGAQRVLLRQGTTKCGQPTAAQLAALERITDVERLERLVVALLALVLLARPGERPVTSCPAAPLARFDLRVDLVNGRIIPCSLAAPQGIDNGACP